MFNNASKTIVKKFFLVCSCLLLLWGCEKKKDNVILYTSQHNKDITVLIDAFQKKYPDIHIEVFRSGTTEIVDKLLLEVRNNNIQPDVIMISDIVAMENLKRKRLLGSLDGIQIAEDLKAFFDSDKTYCGTKRISIGVIFNKNLTIKPTSFADLNKPEFKDKIVMPSPFYSGAAALMLGIFIENPKFGWDFYTKLKSNNIMIVNGNASVVEAVANGKKMAGIVVDFMAFNAKHKGSPVDFIDPEEGIVTITEPIALIKKKDENYKPQAKKFVEFVLSEEGQDLAKNLGYMPIKGLHPWEKKVMSFSAENVLENLEANKSRFAELFKN
ncbi:MAG: ABC transporter substrate-binding protein [Alphaproteobacteria bacterium]|nr:ABC transporter substrate-binding protein [Alphaproteobacteria bacterium]